MTLDKNEFVKQYTILDRISEVKLLVENENWQSALMAVLTLPDICGKIKYPENGSGKRYRDWFNEHCAKYYMKKRMRLTESYSNKAYFTGDMCWKLRNSFLHAGSDVVNNWDNKDENGNQKGKMNYEFELNINGTDMYGELKGKLIPLNKADLEIRPNNAVSLNINRLCNVICDEAYKFLSTEQYRKDIDLYTINIVDYKEMANTIRSNE